MLENIWQIAIHTPVWVYILFIFLLRVGYKATKTRVVSFYQLLILPLFFTFMSAQTLITTVNPNLVTLSMFSIALLLGMIAGGFQLHLLNIKVDQKNKLMTLPGTWLTLIIILIVFASKYYFSFELAINPQKALELSFVISMLGISGICTGLFMGRLLYCFYRLKR